MNHTRIGEIMTEDVVTLESGQAAPAAQELLRMLHVRHLPVVNKAGELVGLVTHRKLLAEHARLLQQTSEQSETGDDSRDFALSIPISKVMEKDVQRATPEMFVADALELMLKNRVGSLPVVDAGDQVVGIVTSFDLLTFQLNKLRSEGEGTPENGPSPSPELSAELADKLVLALHERATLQPAAKAIWMVAVVALLSLAVAVLALHQTSSPVCSPAAAGSSQTPAQVVSDHAGARSEPVTPTTPSSAGASSRAEPPARPASKPGAKPTQPDDTTGTLATRDSGARVDARPARSSRDAAPNRRDARMPQRERWVPERALDRYRRPVTR